MVVLDMDETLIHSQIEVVTTNGTEASAGVHDPRQGEDRAEGQSSKAVHDFEFNIPISQCLGQGELRIKVFKRPGLESFLEEASSFCHLAVFTAGSEDYAKAVLDRLDPCGRMSLRLYRDSCSVVDGLFLKDLNRVGRADLSRVVLVDNSPVSLLINPDNSILVSSFYANPDDTTLALLLPILRKLHHSGDVRQTLEKDFQMRQALEQSGWDLADIKRRHLDRKSVV